MTTDQGAHQSCFTAPSGVCDMMKTFAPACRPTTVATFLWSLSTACDDACCPRLLCSASCASAAHRHSFTQLTFLGAHSPDIFRRHTWKGDKILHAASPAFELRPIPVSQTLLGNSNALAAKAMPDRTYACKE